VTVRRRTLLRASLAAPVAAATVPLLTAGCAAERVTQVAVVWSDTELALFEAVIAAYQRERRRRVEVISVGNNIDGFLRSRHRAGTSPDVAILSSPGNVLSYLDPAGEALIEPMRPDIRRRYARDWNELLTGRDGELYGAWVKAAHKSLLWYRRDRLGRPPGTWAELLDLVRERATPAGPAPLAVGAADGWVLTDWLENLIAAHTSPDQYKQFATDLAAGGSWNQPAVVASLTMLAELWGVPYALPGGGSRALLTQFDESVIQVAADPPRALMAVEGDFAASVIRDFGPVAAVPFPAATDRRPLLVGGDAAVVLAGADPAAHDLVDWLTRPDSFGPWMRPGEFGYPGTRGGYLSPLAEVGPAEYGDDFSRQRAAELASTTDLRFDLTDRLSGFAGGGDGVGSWKVLQDFFAEVTTPGADGPAAVARAVAALDRRGDR
jgi:hypothetical protein